MKLIVSQQHTGIFYQLAHSEYSLVYLFIPLFARWNDAIAITYIITRLKKNGKNIISYLINNNAST